MTEHPPLTDAELMAVLDGTEGSAELRTRALTSPDSARRLAELEAAATFVDDLLSRDAAQGAGPGQNAGAPLARRSGARVGGKTTGERRSMVPWLIAATLVLLFAGRGPLVAFVNSWRSTEPVEVQPAIADAPQSYGFTVGDTVVVHLVGRLPTSLRVVADGSAEASLRLEGARASDEVTIDGSRVEVLLEGEHAVHVELTVPGATQEVILRTTDAEIRPSWDPSSTAVPREWRLTPPG
ncbi:MAG: hypothetical protein AAF389_03045 [Gemmatimonadota bacterium]